MAALGNGLCEGVLKVGTIEFKLIRLFFNLFINLNTKMNTIRFYNYGLWLNYLIPNIVLPSLLGRPSNQLLYTLKLIQIFKYNSDKQH